MPPKSDTERTSEDASLNGASLKDSVLRTAKRLGWFPLARRVTRRGLRILCFHGFAAEDEAQYRGGTFLRRETLAARLQLLADEAYPVLPLNEAVRRLYEGTLPDGATVITVDDGFYTTSTIFRAALRHHDFPATVYQTTYYMQKRTPVFRLVVTFMIWRARGRYVDISGLPGYGDARVDLSSESERDRFGHCVISYGETKLDEPGRVELSRRLGKLLGVDYDEIADRRLMSLMTADEVRELGEDLDIQLHTHRHVFPADDEKRCIREVVQNREILESITGKPANHLCYPSGLYEPAQLSWLDSLGVVSSTTSNAGFNYAGTSPLELNRYLDQEANSQLVFEAEMSGFLELARHARRATRSLRRGKELARIIRGASAEGS